MGKHQYEQRLEQLVEARTEQLKYLAYYDELTGLPNRVLLSDRLTRAIANDGEGSAVAVLVTSPDRFRDIRDTLGQEQAELLLKDLAQRLRHAFRPKACSPGPIRTSLRRSFPGSPRAEDVEGFTLQIADVSGHPLPPRPKDVHHSVGRRESFPW